MAQLRARQLLCLAACICLAPALAIYEEQAGEHDWLLQHVGRVQHAALGSGKQLIVGTEANAVAALGLDTGAVQWRRVLGDGDRLDGILLLEQPSKVVTLSQNGTLLRGWNRRDGGLTWERSISTGASLFPAKLAAAEHSGLPAIAVLTGAALKVYAASNGRLLQQVGLQQAWRAASNIVVSDGMVQAAGLTASGALDLVKLTLGSGGEALSSSSAVPAAASQLAPAQPLVLLANNVVGLSADRAGLCSVPVSEKGLGSKLSCSPLKALGSDTGSSNAGRLVPIPGAPVVGVQAGDNLLLLRCSEGKPELVTSVQGGTAAAFVAGQNALLVAGASAPGEIQLTTVSLGHQSTATSYKVPLHADSFPQASEAAIPITGVWASSDGARVALSAADHSLACVHQRQLQWSQEQALGSFTGTLFLDLPAPTPAALAEYRAAAPSLRDWIHLQILMLKVQFSIATAEDVHQLSHLKAALSDRLKPTRDPNGFRKLVVALTAAGKLFGLHSGNGHPLWAVMLPEEHKPQQILPWRTMHDVQHAPEIVALHTHSSASGFAVINAHTGDVVSSQEFDFPVDQHGKHRKDATLEVAAAIPEVIDVPQRLVTGTAEQSLYLLVSGTEQPSVHLLPDTPESRGFVKALPQDLFFWQADKASGVLQGLHISKETLAVTKLWENVATAAGDRLLAVEGPQELEHVTTHAKILGDRGLKFKYLSPNTALIVTGVPDGVLTSDLGPSQRDSMKLSVQILDTVTGRPLYRQMHQGARGPVQAVFCENWVVYHYWSVLNHRSEMTVLELYNTAHEDVQIQDLLFGGSRNETLSSSQPVPIEVLRQSFFIGTGIKVMAVTSTTYGITTKQLVLGTASDQPPQYPEQVYLLDKRLLDPRRPVGVPTEADKMEQLIPYNEVLPLNPSQFATHSQRVAGLRGVATTPANLESTSLLLAYGLDVFATRIQPSKAFDSLTDDFPYALLILITTFLLGAVVVLRFMDAGATSKQKWF